MAWSPLCGRTWTGSLASFTAMWTLMMVPMMLPAVLPVLRRCRSLAVAARSGAGYFLVWGLQGAAVFAFGAAIAQAQLRSPALANAASALVAATVIAAGAYQLSAWKSRALAHCRDFGVPPDRALRAGVKLGLHCSASCAGLTVVLLVAGHMDPVAMAAITAAIAAERLAPGGDRIARASGLLAVGLGLFMMRG